MRKSLTIFCGLALTALFAGNAFGQNANAFFKIDSDLKTAGYQEASKPYVQNIGSTKQVGFALYAQQCDNLKGFSVTFEWDGAKATRRTASSVSITDDEININGETMTPAAEANILGGSLISAGEKNEPGLYTISWAQQGGAATTTPAGLLYFAVFRTTDTFKVGDQLAIKATVSVSDENGKERSLGSRYFVVNQVDVKSATWGEVKSQFKDF